MDDRVFTQAVFVEPEELDQFLTYWAFTYHLQAEVYDHGVCSAVSPSFVAVPSHWELGPVCRHALALDRQIFVDRVNREEYRATPEAWRRAKADVQHLFYQWWNKHGRTFLRGDHSPLPQWYKNFHTSLGEPPWTAATS